MKYLTSLLCASFLSLSLSSAPVPKKQPKPNTSIKFEGKFKLMWGGSEWVMWFSKEGYSRSTLPDGDQPWDGNFSWDDKMRTLSVKEKAWERDVFMNWSVILDKDMKGKASITDGFGGSISVEFTKVSD